MKLVIIKTITASLLLSILLFTGCTKDTVVGPTGPIGATGPTGPAGNANVESYQFVTIPSPSSWTPITGGGWQAVYSGLTLNTNYSIQVSMVTGNTNTAMPYTSTTGITYGFSWDLQHIYITAYTFPSTSIPNPGAQTFNIIIIP